MTEKQSVITIPELYNIFKKNPKISTDTRNIKENEIFWALKGENFDGNKFVENAIKNGASFAVTSNLHFAENPKCIYVPNTLKTLQNLANFHRRNLKIPIIAITGTGGKTTTKELIYAVLKKKYKVGATKGNFNNHIGLPLTLLSFDEKTEIGVVETGANHKGEIKKLCEIAVPNYGIITNIGKAHLEGFGSYEAVIETKNELYNAVRKNKGTIFINNENKILKQLATNIKLVKYGKNENSFYIGKLQKTSIFVEISVKYSRKEFLIKSKLFGKYNFENILAAVSVGDYFGVKSEEIKNAIENYEPKNNRSQVLKIKNKTIILDAYNANPMSMKAALENFYSINSGKKVFILGDMLELGKEEIKEHKKIIELLNLQNSKNKFPIFLVGKIFTEVMNETKNNTNIKCFSDTKTLSQNILNYDFSESFILLKASRGIKLETIIDFL